MAALTTAITCRSGLQNHLGSIHHSSHRSPVILQRCQSLYFKASFKGSHARPVLRRSLTCQASAETPIPPSSSAPLPTLEFSSLKKHTWEWKGYKTTYVTVGCGKPIVLVHGFGASAGHYRRMIPVLADQGFKVYALDLLGFGSSDKPIIDYSMEIWDQQIRDFMDEFIGDVPAVIVGNSVGSLASLMVAATTPERINGVVLLNCAGGMNNKAIADDWRIKLAMPIFLLVDWLLKQPKIARNLFDNVRATENLKKVLESVYPRNPQAVDDDLVAMLHGPSCDPGALETFVSCITGPPGPRPEDLVPKIQAPLLLLWGDADPFTPSDGPVGRYFQSLPEQRGNTQFIHLAGVGHCPFDEAPEDVHEQLLPWLKSL